MKNLIVAMIALIAFSNASMAQTTKEKTAKTAKVIVMVNTASWCPACKANGKRVEQQVISNYMQNNNYQIVVNDLSNDDTKAVSKTKCAEAGISGVALNNKGTGVIYFINSQTKEIISQISVTKTSEQIKNAFDSAIKTI